MDLHVAKHYTKLNSEVTMIKGRIYRHVHVALFFKIKKPEHTRRDQLTCTFIFSSKYNLKRNFCFQQQKREGPSINQSRHYTPSSPLIRVDHGHNKNNYAPLISSFFDKPRIYLHDFYLIHPGLVCTYHTVNKC